MGGYNPTIQNPDDYLPSVDMAEIRGEIADDLTGDEIAEHADLDVLDSLYVLACNVWDATDQQKRSRQFDLLDKFVRHAVAAREAAIDKKLKRAA